MKRWRVDITYTVYVENDEPDDLEAIAVEYLDTDFAHAYNVEVTPLDTEPDDFTFRLNGWARDTQEQEA